VLVLLLVLVPVPVLKLLLLVLLVLLVVLVGRYRFPALCKRGLFCAARFQGKIYSLASPHIWPHK